MKNIFIALLFCIILPLSAQNRGGDNEFGEVIISDARQNVTLSGKQWAVFIAIDDYQEWSPLLYPVSDAKEIKDILLKYYFFNETEIRELYNKDATVEAIRRLLIELQEKTGPNDSVFVFHAGHGINESKTKTTAWIPYDGGKDVIKQANWLPHLKVREMLDSLKARHVFLISDSCYSGDFLDQKRGMSEPVNNYPAAYNNVSRQAMSSGASQKVDDLSEFASRLKSILLRTEKAYITPEFLLSQIIENKTTRPLSTIPLLAVIPGSSHELGGSFLFFRKNPKEFPPFSPLTESNTEIEKETKEFFVGTWLATVNYNDNYDSYRIVFSNNGKCTVTISNDNAEQETTGNWSWDNKTKRLKVTATFRNAKITYQRNIEWIAMARFTDDNNYFRINARPATNAANLAPFDFFRE